MNRFEDAPWMDRPNRDIPTIAATLAVAPAIVLMAFGANRLGLIHLVPVVAAILPFAATDWKSAALLRASAAFLLGVFALLGGMTIGVVFVPSVALMTWGTVRAGGRYDSERREANP
ncbi:MAG: hypothetical protein OXI71_16490 [Gemmatimonadota bacterium]|nr:hypothetical protein [Gemmatimonadota bacterium]MXX35773.1 hypothetical protein [Gemmatimonadota bacterium]MYA11366.1 hypothetical protein [Gemmatimonadota bacterium]MYD15052.1 hypothetical protein [Gemmatimonadota bacterium]